MADYVIDRESCSRHAVFPGVEFYTTASKHMTLSLAELEPGAVIPPHSHPHEQVGVLLEGDMELVVDGQRCQVSPGQMWKIPGDVEHSVTAGPQGARAMDIFHPVREDYR